MDKEVKNQFRNFISRAGEKGIIKNDIEDRIYNFFNFLNELEEKKIIEKEVYFYLEDSLLKLIDLIKDRYIEYGALIYEITEYYDNFFDPFKDLDKFDEKLSENEKKILKMNKISSPADKTF